MTALAQTEDELSEIEAGLAGVGTAEEAIAASVSDAWTRRAEVDQRRVALGVVRASFVRAGLVPEEVSA